MTSAEFTRAVEIARAIEDEAASLRNGAVVGAPEVMDYPLCPPTAAVRGHLEHDAGEQTATSGRCTVKIARAIEGEAGLGVLPVAPAAEVMQDCRRPASAAIGAHLEHDAKALGAAGVCGAVQIAGAIHDQPGIRSLPVAAVEAMDHCGRPAPAAVRARLEYRPAPVSAVYRRAAAGI